MDARKLNLVQSFDVPCVIGWDIWSISTNDECKNDYRKANAMTETIIYGYAADNQRSLFDRFVRIEEKDGTKYEMPFPSKEVTDSKALHYLLSYIDPGDEYTVVFGKKEN